MNELPPVSGNPFDSPIPSDGEVPVAIGPFAILGVLGRGGFATVYHAQQLDPNREVALKVLHAGRFNWQQRLREEADLLAKMSHPGIAKLFQVGEVNTTAGPQVYLVMELISGGRLDAYISRNSLGLRAQLKMLVEICDAVQHAHQKGVIHRDLKPSNILVDEEGRPKVLDFGLSFISSDDRPGPSGTVAGTPIYMSPEQAAGRVEDIDVRSDVYALGIIAYEMISGRRPFATEGKTISQVLMAIQEDDPCPLKQSAPDCPADVVFIVDKAISRVPNQRYSTASELAADLRRFLACEPILARRRTFTYYARLYCQRNKGLVVSAAIAFTMLFMGVGLVVRAILVERQQRIRQADRDRQDLLKSYLARADVAIERGAWQVVLDAYQQAFALEPTSATPALRLRRLRALDGLSRTGKIQSEIDELRQTPDLSNRERALLELWYANSRLFHPGESDEVRELFQIVAKSDLPPAEREYALGMSATNSQELVVHLAQAVKLDPGLQQGWSTLGFFYLIRGDFPKLAQVAEVGHAFFPDDPSFQMLNVIQAALTNDSDAVESGMAALTPVLDESQLSAFRTAVNVFKTVAKFEELSVSERATVLTQLPVQILTISFQSNNRNFATSFWIPSFLSQSYRLPVRHFFAFSSAKLGWKSAVDEFTEGVKVHPDGLLFKLLGDLYEANDRYEEAETAYRNAVSAPSFINIKRSSLAKMLLCQLMQRRAAQGRNDNSAVVELTRRADDTVNQFYVLVANRRLGTQDEADTRIAVDVARQMGSFDIARLLLEKMESVSQDPEFSRLRAAIEYSSGAYEKGIEWAEITLRRNPSSAMREEMKAFMIDCRQKAREAGERVNSGAPTP